MRYRSTHQVCSTIIRPRARGSPDVESDVVCKLITVPLKVAGAMHCRDTGSCFGIIKTNWIRRTFRHQLWHIMLDVDDEF